MEERKYSGDSNNHNTKAAEDAYDKAQLDINRYSELVEVNTPRPPPSCIVRDGWRSSVVLVVHDDWRQGRERVCGRQAAIGERAIKGRWIGGRRGVGRGGAAPVRFS